MASFLNDFNESMETLGTIVSGYFPFFGDDTSKITDINTKSKEHSVDLYCVCSDNVSDVVKGILARNLQVKYVAALMVILQNVILKDPKNISKWTQNKIANDRVKGLLKDIVPDAESNAIVESVLENLEPIMNSLKISDSHTLNEAQSKLARDHKLATRPIRHMPANATFELADRINRQNANTQQAAQRLVDNDEIHQAASHAVRAKMDLDNEKHIAASNQNTADVLAQNARVAKHLSAQDFVVDVIADHNLQTGKSGGLHNDDYLEFGTLIKVGMQYIDGTGVVRTAHIAFNVHVNMVIAEFDKIKEAIISTKDRDTFFQYLKWRAGHASFLKDFTLNLREIDKEVERDTDSSIQGRIMSDMVRNSGFLTPKILSDLNESRHYALALDKGDVDMLKRDSKFDIQARAGLNKVFEKLRILDLIIVNSDRSTLTFHDSSDPSKYDVKDYKKITNDDDLMKRFIMSMKD